MAGTDGSLVTFMEKRFGPQPVVHWLDLCLDSGASFHMMRDSRILSNVRDLSSPIVVEVADGNKLRATAVGDIDTEYVKLPGVHVVPGLKMNLVSVLQLADVGIFATFRKNHAELYKEGERVGGAVVDGGLYKVRFLTVTGDAAPAPPREQITSYAANAASSYMNLEEALKFMEEALVTSFKNHAVPADWVLRFGDPAVPVDWMERFKEKILFRGDWFAPTAEMDENDKTDGAAYCNNMIRDGPFVPGKAHLGSDGMHEAEFIKVQLNEHRLNA